MSVRIVKSKIRELNKQKLVDLVRIRNYKKINFEQFLSDDCNRKPYIDSLNVQDARLRFKIASFMTPTVKMKFQSEKRFGHVILV